jgi:hypothetical protein
LSSTFRVGLPRLNKMPTRSSLPISCRPAGGGPEDVSAPLHHQDVEHRPGTRPQPRRSAKVRARAARACTDIG